MKAEPNLSDKMFLDGSGRCSVFYIKDVREKIKELQDFILDLMERNNPEKEDVSTIEDDYIDGDLILNKIDKLFGKELTEAIQKTK